MSRDTPDAPARRCRCRRRRSGGACALDDEEVQQDEPPPQRLRLRDPAGAMASQAARCEPHALDALWSTVESRRGADPSSSWTAKLLSKGVNKCAQKVGEEATEVVIEAAVGNKAGVVSESADLLYHLEVLWAATGVAPADVWAELARREGVSGVAEKASRPKN